MQPRPWTGMWMLFLLFAGVPAGAGAASAPHHDDDDWEWLGTSQGVTVFRRHEGVSDVVSVRGIGTVSAPAQEVFEAIIDNRHAHEWMPMVSERRDVRAVDANARIEYTHIEMPWPLEDRYLVAESRVDRFTDGSFQLSTQSVERPEVTEKGKILAFMHFSHIFLRPLPHHPELTEITIELNSDPQGAVPKWLVNMFQKDWPREFIGNLQRYVHRRETVGTP